ncbi:MAG: ABC transporter ATP-binding protein [Candidatus Pacebacteria bacterium]|nr:ABC transporter ATP-binding protein [Candidatus Paceibacterota bacterium]
MNIIWYFQEKTRETNLSETLAQYLQEYSLRRILNLTVSQHVEDHSAIKLTIINRGEGATSSIISALIINVIPTILYTIIALSTLAYYNSILGIVSFFIMLGLFYLSYRFRVFHYPYVLQNRDNWVEQNKRRTESFTHLTLAKFFGRENFFIKKYLEKREAAVQHHMITRMLSVSHVFKRSNIQDTAELISLGIAAILYLQGSFAVGVLYLVFSLTSKLYYNINNFSSLARDLPVWYLEAEKYLEAVEKEPSFREGGLKNTSFTQNITINDLSFSYPQSKAPVLDGVSCTIPTRKVTAFVGSSGSGKSTIVKLLLRAYDYSYGSILIGKEELKNIDARYLREHIGYVEQHVDLLDDTIKENILLGAKDGERKEKEEKLEEVAVHSRITEFYHRLGEKRFETVVGERGIKLSGGERQRVGIARAIIKNPEILIFDEATSSLDTENEAKVMEAINEVSKGKTTIIIAHRLSTVRDADKIIVMDKGKVVGEGTHDELLKKNEVYKNLVAHQV